MGLFKNNRFLISNHKILDEVFKLHVNKYENKKLVEVPDHSLLEFVELDFSALSRSLGIEGYAVYSRIYAYNKNRQGIFNLHEIEQPPSEGYQYESEHIDSVNFSELCNELAILNEKRRKEWLAMAISLFALLISILALFRS